MNIFQALQKNRIKYTTFAFEDHFQSSIIRITFFIYTFTYQCIIHGTKKAIVAGLLGMQPDDYQIAESFEIAQKQGIDICFGSAKLEEAHPNTAVICLHGIGDRYTEVQVSSIGGSRISIDKIDGINTGFSGECPTLIVHNIDQPGCVVAVTSMLAKKNVNIATMQVYRSAKGKQAVMVVECDQPVSEDGISWLEQVEGVLKVTYFAGIGVGL